MYLHRNSGVTYDTYSQRIEGTPRLGQYREAIRVSKSTALCAT